jgi:hypothetical protein
MLRVVIDLFQLVLINHRLIESSSFRPEMSQSSRISTEVPPSIRYYLAFSRLVLLKATYTSLGLAANSKRTYVLSTDHVFPLISIDRVLIVSYKYRPGHSTAWFPWSSSFGQVTDEMHAVTSEHDRRKQFGFVAKVFWQSSRVDSVGQLMGCGHSDYSEVGKLYGIIHLL